MAIGASLFALLAGILSTLSPCALPLLPLVLGAAVSEHRFGPVVLATGLAVSFVAIGLFVATIGFSIGLDADVLRVVATLLLLVVGFVLMVPQLQTRVAVAGGVVGNWSHHRFSGFDTTGLKGQFAVGLLLGAVWSPCVGPTLGAASVLVAQGKDLGQVAIVMAAFGVGAALPLLLLALVSREVMLRWRDRLLQAGQGGKGDPWHAAVRRRVAEPDWFRPEAQGTSGGHLAHMAHGGHHEVLIDKANERGEDMTDIVALIPRQPVPPLKLDIAGGGTFKLDQERPANFTLVVFYRGLHCPICKTQLRELESKLGEFDKRGVAVVAASSDTRERAEETKRSWGLAELRLGYGLDLAAARRWGLFISTGRGMTSAGVDEPARFSEPALYLIKPDGTLYFGSVQTMPFARPHFSDILLAIDYVLKNNYPARGEVREL